MLTMQASAKSNLAGREDICFSTLYNSLEIRLSVLIMHVSLKLIEFGYSIGEYVNWSYLKIFCFINILEWHLLDGAHSFTKNLHELMRRNINGHSIPNRNF